MLRANAVTVKPQSGCKDCLLQHAKRFQTISNATVVSHEEKDLLSSHSCHYYVQNEVLLGTADVHIQESSGNYALCRAMLDSGSQVSFISRACATKLNLDIQLTHLHVAGVAASYYVDKINHFAMISLQSVQEPAFRCEVEAYLWSRK